MLLKLTASEYPPFPLRENGNNQPCHSARIYGEGREVSLSILIIYAIIRRCLSAISGKDTALSSGQTAPPASTHTTHYTSLQSPAPLPEFLLFRRNVRDVCLLTSLRPAKRRDAVRSVGFHVAVSRRRSGASDSMNRGIKMVASASDSMNQGIKMLSEASNFMNQGIKTLSEASDP
ncbi:MAG: hypothetical protein LBS79_01740, partial [Tannerella sp.]|nr:hypothetical protein [Tannerella sp.]